jgi:hypothetical protein
MLVSRGRTLRSFARECHSEWPRRWQRRTK